MTREQAWHLYLLDCDGRLYTGISTNPQRRLEEHRAGGSRGARFTRGCQCVTLLWQVHVGERGWAQRAEYRLRKLRRSRKLSIAERVTSWPQLRSQLFPET